MGIEKLVTIIKKLNDAIILFLKNSKVTWRNVVLSFINSQKTFWDSGKERVK